MKTVCHQRDHINAELFVGRESELLQMNEAVTNPKCKILHIHSIGGLGKSALLRHFCRMYANINCYYLHLIELPTYRSNSQSHYSILIEKASESFNNAEARYAIELEELPNHFQSYLNHSAPTVLILDTFDSWEPLHVWLRKILLPSLPINVRIFTASRNSFDEIWIQEGEWTKRIRQIQLQPLDKIASFCFTEAYGFHDFETCHYLAKHALGLPIALRKLCEDTKQEGIDHVKSKFYQNQLFNYLSNCSLQGMNLNDEEHDLLDTASLLWNFDIDVISHLLHNEISTTMFRKFCRLPFVEMTDFGWRIIHVARYWFRREFFHRSPRRYNELKMKAKHYWLEKLTFSKDEEKQEIYVNLLHLSDNDSLHTFCFQESYIQFVKRPLPREELSIVRDMFVNFHQKVPAFFRENTYQEQYLELYWGLSPDTFYGFYSGGRLAMFMSMLPLTSEIRKELEKNPVYYNYIKNSEYTDNETLMWIASFLPEYGSSAVGRVFLHGFSQIAGRGSMIVITPFLEAHQLIEGIDFERLPLGDYLTKDGLLHKAYRLKLKNIGTLKTLIRPEKEHKSLASVILSHKEAIEHVKNILVHFQEFEQKADIVNRCPYMHIRSHMQTELNKAAEDIRKFFTTTLKSWSENKEPFAVYGDIHMCYINKIGTHELIAARLNLSLSTYYRYLRKGISLLAHAYLENLLKQNH